MSRKGMSSSTTREQILDAATRLFAEQGIAATSVRQIVNAANVNSAAVHYHFGSKEELVVEAFRSFIEAVNNERLEKLTSLEKQFPAGAPVREILDALLRPAVIYCMNQNREETFL